MPDPGARPEHVVEASHVDVELGEAPILHDVELTVSRGDVLAVLGENGSGKSTLVRTMLGLVPATRGEVRLFGRPVQRFRDWRRVGFVPQRTSAAGGVPATVREVVGSGRLSRRRLLQPLRRTDREAIEEAIAAVGLGDRAGHGVATLSGGQQQRVLIARALAGRPDVLVMDEPNAGVDAPSQQAFAEALKALVAAGGTLVVVLHELGPLAPLIERVLVMRAGRVGYDGPPPASFHELAHHHGHHHDDIVRPGHVPAVSSPLEDSP